MRRLLTGVAMVALSLSIGACNKQEAAENNEAAADANTEVLVDENAAMDANAVTTTENAATDANATDANATTNADAATTNAE